MIKLIVVLGASQSVSSGGVRIRYLRMANAFLRHGFTITVVSIDSLDFGFIAIHDVVLLSKAYTEESIKLCSLHRQRGGLCGVDVFDFYLGLSTSERISRIASWYNRVIDTVDFLLCASSRMKESIHATGINLPVHVMRDCVDETCIDEPAAEALAQLLSHKQQRFNETGQLSLAWFGIGDNPVISVGLHDLANYSSCLQEFSSAVYNVHLTVLTNERALHAKSLNMLKSLLVPYSLDIWSEQKERELLRRSDIAFIPVGLSQFSTVKSANRALTALSSGCQVLTCGHPIYSDFSTHIYYDSATIIRDFGLQSLRHRAERLPDFYKLIKELADPFDQAARAAIFLDSLHIR